MLTRTSAGHLGQFGRGWLATTAKRVRNRAVDRDLTRLRIGSSELAYLSCAGPCVSFHFSEDTGSQTPSPSQARHPELFARGRHRAHRAKAGTRAARRPGCLADSGGCPSREGTTLRRQVLGVRRPHQACLFGEGKRFAAGQANCLCCMACMICNSSPRGFHGTLGGANRG